jgi:hypothetical protein
MQESPWVKLLTIALPVVTFVLGYFLNRLIERRRSANTRLTQAAADLITLLNEWHTALSDLAVVCGSSNSTEDIQKAFDRYRKQRSIATRIQFCLALLRKQDVARPLTAAVECIYDQLNPDHHELIRPASFATIDAMLRHGLTAKVANLLMILEDSQSPDRLSAIRSEIADFYLAFDQVLGQATLEAASLIESLD